MQAEEKMSKLYSVSIIFFFTEGLYGMAVAGGVIIGVASILGLGIAMSKK